MTIPTPIDHIIASHDILESALEACQTVQAHIKTLGIPPEDTLQALRGLEGQTKSPAALEVRCAAARVNLVVLLGLYCPGSTLRRVVLQILRSVYSQAAATCGPDGLQEHPDLGSLVLMEVKEGPNERVH